MGRTRRVTLDILCLLFSEHSNVLDTWLSTGPTRKPWLTFLERQIKSDIAIHDADTLFHIRN